MPLENNILEYLEIKDDFVLYTINDIMLSYTYRLAVSENIDTFAN